LWLYGDAQSLIFEETKARGKGKRVREELQHKPSQPFVCIERRIKQSERERGGGGGGMTFDVFDQSDSVTAALIIL